MKKFLASALLLSLAFSGPAAEANAVGDFFKKIGHSLSKLGKSQPSPKSTPHKSGNTSERTSPTPSPMPTPNPAKPPVQSTPVPTPTPVDIRPAALAPHAHARRDVPFGVAVPNKPGFVTSPYAPNQGYVDVRAFPPSTEVLDPFTGKIFLTP
ncbi:MAG TPA: hypothetical protein VGI60_01405 [Chthoniobacterales bacterium]|jgi:hypothetical protein